MTATVVVPPGIRLLGAVRVRVPFVRPVVTAGASWEAVDSWLLRFVDADGRAGLGEATLGPGAAPTDHAELAARVRSMVGTRAGSGDGVVGAALASGIGGAMLDLGIEADGRARAAHVELNATIGAEATEASVAAARAAVAAGFRCLKLKGGAERSSGELAERLAAVRAAVGPDVALRLDVNGAWDAATAAERLRAVVGAGAGLAYVEQPVPADDVAGLTRVRAAVDGVRVAADEAVTSRTAAAALVAAGAVDVLVVKPARVGGPAAALAIAEDAAAAGVGVTISTLLETGVGLAAAIVTVSMLPAGVAAGPHGLATGGLLAADLVAAGPRGVGPVVAVPAGPGLGIRLDHAAVERFAVERVGAWA
ncbi:MAG: mandelate racemase/muconate lactonizing enzyme family protein [Chloroflexota bacterium]